jgi:hypothetical protein
MGYSLLMNRIRIWDTDAIARAPTRDANSLDVPDTDQRPGETHPEWCLRMLLKHLQALAADPDVVIHAYPPDCDISEILADDFTEYLERSGRAVREGLVPEDYLNQAELVGRRFQELYGRSDPSLWTNEAMRREPEWAGLRRLAADALEAMGYDLEPPPPGSM